MFEFAGKFYRLLINTRY